MATKNLGDKSNLTPEQIAELQKIVATTPGETNQDGTVQMWWDPTHTFMYSRHYQTGTTGTGDGQYATGPDRSRYTDGYGAVAPDGLNYNTYDENGKFSGQLARDDGSGGAILKLALMAAGGAYFAGAGGAAADLGTGGSAGLSGLAGGGSAGGLSTGLLGSQMGGNATQAQLAAEMEGGTSIGSGLTGTEAATAAGTAAPGTEAGTFTNMADNSLGVNLSDPAYTAADTAGTTAAGAGATISPAELAAQHAVEMETGAFGTYMPASGFTWQSVLGTLGDAFTKGDLAKLVGAGMMAVNAKSIANANNDQQTKITGMNNDTTLAANKLSNDTSLANNILSNKTSADNNALSNKTTLDNTTLQGKNAMDQLQAGYDNTEKVLQAKFARMNPTSGLLAPYLQRNG